MMTEYFQPDNQPRNLHNALQYNSEGKVEMRVESRQDPAESYNVHVDNQDPIPVTLGSETITIIGNITIPTTVNVASSPTDPVHVHVTEVGTSGLLDVPYMPVGMVGNVNTTITNTPTVTLGSGSTDAFGRLRTSSPFTLFDSFHRYQDNGKITEYTAGGGSSTFNSNAGCIDVTVTGTLGSLVYRESSRVFSYQPGKSLLITQSFCMAPGVVGLRQRHGYFDTASGFYLELDGTTLNLVRRSSVTGVLQETRVPQSQWNTDTLGAGVLNPSGITLDITRDQILFTDIEWLGVGTGRMGFVINGEFVTCHAFNHANLPSTPTSDTTLPYMITACLPVRAEIENTGNTGIISTYRIICTSVISEGGYELRGRPLSVGHALNTSYTLATRYQLYPILSIRLKPTRLGAVVIPRNFSLAVGSSANYRFTLISGGVTSGGAGWVDAAANSSVQYKLDATSIVGGTILEMGYITATNQSSVSPSLADYPFKFQLERDTFTNTPYEFTLCCASDSNSGPKVWSSINWEELT
jgi:hypothetical protein